MILKELLGIVKLSDNLFKKVDSNTKIESPGMKYRHYAPNTKCVLVVDNDVGNGSILMRYFIKYCKTTDAKYICGQLSLVDKGHFYRSEHFYKKHEFNVKFTSDRSAGSIKYILAEDTTESKKWTLELQNRTLEEESRILLIWNRTLIIL